MGFGIRNAHLLPKNVLDELRFFQAQLSEFLSPLTTADGTLAIPEVVLPESVTQLMPYLVIFHGDIEFGTDEFGDQPTTITLQDPVTGATPASANEIWVQLNGPFVDPNNINVQISWVVTSPSQVTFTRHGEGVATIDPTTFKFTAFWWSRRES